MVADQIKDQTAHSVKFDLNLQSEIPTKLVSSMVNVK